MRLDGIGDAVRTHLRGVGHGDLHAAVRTAVDEVRPGAEGVRERRVPHLGENGHDARDGRRLDVAGLVVAQRKEAAEMRVKLVRSVCAVRLEAPALADAAILEQADGAYVNREEHGCPFAVAA